MPPTICIYDGTSDLDDHINLFRSAGEVALWPMPLWCKIFVQTLFGAVVFGGIDYQLRGSIVLMTWCQNSRNKFSQQRRRAKDRNEVLRIRRRDNETVENFQARFNKQSIAIPGLTQDLACGAFLQGVNDDELLRKLHDRNEVSDTIEEIMKIAKVYVHQEKSILASHVANKKRESYRESSETDRRGGKIKS
ncbi:hypothetical protein Hdeb2414_s0026g00672431 [Helianthus debilis subsp. tardiflorus]